MDRWIDPEDAVDWWCGRSSAATYALTHPTGTRWSPAPRGERRSFRAQEAFRDAQAFRGGAAFRER